MPPRNKVFKAKIYTSIDLAWAFWQIPVRKADRQKTAFACELVLFEWRRMTFGLCNASATFQRTIARALQKIVNREGSMVMAYIDDIVNATETVEDHIVQLREVFECLREAGVKMRVAKCNFIKSGIKTWDVLRVSNPILKLWLNFAIEKYHGTKRKCKAFRASPTFIANSFLGIPSSWPPCMLSPASARLSPGG